MLFSNHKLREMNPDSLAKEFIDDFLNVSCYSNASDIHLEPFKEHFLVRMRLDGMLKTMGRYDAHFFPPIVTRAKLLCKMDIAERRAPQDGSLMHAYGEQEVQFRASSIPTIHGEKMVIRRLSDHQDISDIENLGMSPQLLEQWKKLIAMPHGITLVSGPTGSGKTTTLFATLNILNDERYNITTIEDPVEYKIDGICQTQISHIKMGFSDGLRSVLRQDPDIIMVGEIRDSETAEIALRASLTGHKVFSSLHTNDAVSSVVRLLDMGIEPYLVASSINGVLAQRLVRKICPYCKIEYFADLDEKALFKGLKSDLFYKGEGCQECNHTGYYGRIGVYELFLMQGSVRTQVIEHRGDRALHELAKTEQGMRSYLDDALDKAQKGITTLEEVCRISGELMLKG